MTINLVLAMQICKSRVIAQLIFFIMWFFILVKFRVRIISLLESFLAIITFFLLLFSIFIFIIFIIFAGLTSFLLRGEYLYCRIVISCLIYLNTTFIVEFSLIFSIFI